MFRLIVIFALLVCVTSFSLRAPIRENVRLYLSDSPDKATILFMYASQARSPKPGIIDIGGKLIKKQYVLLGNGLFLNSINFLSNEKGELNTTISPLFGSLFLTENFSIKIRSLICNSGNIDPEGIYLGSRIKVLQEEITNVMNKSGNHSLTISLFEDFRKNLRSLKIFFLKLNLLIFKINLTNCLKNNRISKIISFDLITF